MKQLSGKVLPKLYFLKTSLLLKLKHEKWIEIEEINTSVENFVCFLIIQSNEFKINPVN
jgi:hypothetical protein